MRSQSVKTGGFQLKSGHSPAPILPPILSMMFAYLSKTAGAVLRNFLCDKKAGTACTVMPPITSIKIRGIISKRRCNSSSTATAVLIHPQEKAHYRPTVQKRSMSKMLVLLLIFLQVKPALCKTQF